MKDNTGEDDMRSNCHICDACGRRDGEKPHGSYCHVCGQGRRRSGRRETYFDGRYVRFD